MLLSGRRWLLLGLAFPPARLLVALGIFFLVPGCAARSERAGAKVNRSTFVKVELGMSEAEVMAILNAPPGNYRTRRGGGCYMGNGDFCEPPRGTPKEWVSNSCCLTLWFENGSVVGKRYAGAFYERTPIERLLGMRLFPMCERDD